MVRLDDICAINMGQSPDSASYNENGEGMPFFQGNADFGKIHPKVRVWCSAPTKIAHAGDVLISVRAPIGALNIADRECCIGRGLAALTVNEDLCVKDYLWYAIANKVDELNSKGTGSTFKAISKGVLLYDDAHRPLAVIEAKRTCVDVSKGRQQAELYADILEKKHGRRPAIFLTNGFETHILDGQYPERKCACLYSKRDLEKMFNLRTMRVSLKNVIVKNPVWKPSKPLCRKIDYFPSPMLTVMGIRRSERPNPISLC